MKHHYQFETESQQQTERLGERFAAALRAGDVVAMRGGLGAGKTAFTRGIAHALGYAGTVSSPTFAIVNEYRGGRLDLAHFDVYRIEGESDLFGTGFYDYLDGSMLLVIEWSENIPFALEESAITVEISVLSGDRRRITMESERELVF